MSLFGSIGFWLPVLIFKAFAAIFKVLWNFNLWVLQKVSGVPLYYCRPEYRTPGIILGTMGVMAIPNLLFFPVMIAEVGWSEGIFVFVGGLFGLGFLFLCRLMIRRGSI